MASKPALPVLFILSALLFSNGAEACFVEHVKRTATGIDVYFHKGRIVTVTRGTQRVGVFQTYSARTTSVQQVDGAKVVEAVSARLGDRLFTSNSPHDGCSLIVAIRDGKIGLEASAFSQLGRDPPGEVKYFIPAN